MLTGVSLTFPGKIVDAYEVNGQEKKIGTADFTNGILNFDMTGFLIRSFAVKFDRSCRIIFKTGSDHAVTCRLMRMGSALIQRDQMEILLMVCTIPRRINLTGSNQ